MSRKARTRGRSRLATQPQGAFVGGGGFGGSGYTAADQSTARGQIYFPFLNSKKELNSHSRTEIMRKARWLCRNDGLARRFRTGIAEMVGYLRPNPTTADKEWNREALAAFNAIAESPLVFDRAGREDFYQRQITLTERSLEDGDCSVVLTQTGNYNPATALFEAPQMAGGEKEGEWIDGVQINSDGRAIKYRYVDTSRENAVLIDAANVIHFGLFETSQSVRGVSGFAHAVNRMIDIRELDNDTMSGVKASNLFGLYVENTQQDAIGLPLGGPKTTVTNPLAGLTGASGVQKRDITVESIVGPSGKMLELERGQKIGVVHDDRRHPNQQALVDHFVKMIAWGFKMPPEALLTISGTGPAVRFVIRSAERSAERYRQNLERTFCRRFWTYAIAKLMRQGQLRQCSDPKWWACEWIRPESLTIDLGRDYSAGINALQHGAETLAGWYGESSQDWRTQMEQRATEFQAANEIGALKGLTPEQVAALAAAPYTPAAQPQNQPA